MCCDSWGLKSQIQLNEYNWTTELNWRWIERMRIKSLRRLLVIIWFWIYTIIRIILEENVYYVKIFVKNIFLRRIYYNNYVHSCDYTILCTSIFFTFNLIFHSSSREQKRHNHKHSHKYLCNHDKIWLTKTQSNKQIWLVKQLVYWVLVNCILCLPLGSLGFLCSLVRNFLSLFTLV